MVFSRSADALAAMKRYDNVQLDGKNMKIEIIGNNLEVPLSARVNVIGGANGRGRRTVVMTYVNSFVPPTAFFLKLIVTYS